MSGVNPLVKAHYDRLRRKRKESTKLMKAKASSVKHIPKHLKVTPPMKAMPPQARKHLKRLLAEEKGHKAVTPINLKDYPRFARSFGGKESLTKKVERFYGLNNKYRGDGSLRTV